MLTLSRRFLVIAALMFWQGGFTFYAGVVVPIGRNALRSDLEKQTVITNRTTNYLNLAGAVSLLLLGWDAMACRDPSKWRYRTRWLLWLGMAVTLGLLAGLHLYLEGYLQGDEEGMVIASGFRAIFRTGHRAYLWVSTVQWACAVAYVVLSVAAWRGEDLRKPLAPVLGGEGLG
jgi:hypothetical protein